MPGEFWGDEFLSGIEWQRTEKGSYVRIQNGELTATVFEHTASGGWRGVSNIFEAPRFTRGARDTPEAAAELLIEAEAEGKDSKLWSPPSTTDWQPSKTKNGRPGFHRRRPGSILAVRQCEPHPSGRYPPSWVASINAGEAVLNANGKPWFRSADEAMMAADAEYERRHSEQAWR